MTLLYILVIKMSLSWLTISGLELKIKGKTTHCPYNVVVHALTKAATSNASPTFYYYVPQCISFFIFNEMSRVYCSKNKKDMILRHVLNIDFLTYSLST